jgi:inosose dehydratase
MAPVFRIARHDERKALNMANTLTRRAFGKTVLAGLGAAALPSWTAAEARKLKIGCTTLIWGGLPRTSENLEPALKDMATIGFHGFETFASILEDWDKKGMLDGLIKKNGVPLTSAYSTVQVTDPAARKENVAMLIRQTNIIKKYGGRFFVLAPNGVPRASYNFQEHRANIIAALNEYAMAVTDLGLRTGLHQHTGTAVETRDETYAVMEAVNTNNLRFAPDVGQLQKGGADAAKVIKDFKSITAHMHLKDYKGWEHFAGYCPLGQGTVDLKSILDTMEGANPNANIMHELDGSTHQPYTPMETAQIAKVYLQKLGYTFRA